MHLNDYLSDQPNYRDVWKYLRHYLNSPARRAAFQYKLALCAQNLYFLGITLNTGAVFHDKLDLCILSCRKNVDFTCVQFDLKIHNQVIYHRHNLLGILNNVTQIFFSILLIYQSFGCNRAKQVKNFFPMMMLIQFWPNCQ